LAFENKTNKEIDDAGVFFLDKNYSIDIGPIGDKSELERVLAGKGVSYNLANTISKILADDYSNISKNDVRNGDVVRSKDGNRLYTVVEKKNGFLPFTGKMVLEGPRGGKIEIGENDYEKYNFYRKNNQ
jgi:hypothetical protein